MWKLVTLALSHSIIEIRFAGHAFGSVELLLRKKEVLWLIVGWGRNDI